MNNNLKTTIDVWIQFENYDLQLLKKIKKNFYISQIQKKILKNKLFPFPNNISISNLKILKYLKNSKEKIVLKTTETIEELQINDKDILILELSLFFLKKNNKRN